MSEAARKVIDAKARFRALRVKPADRPLAELFRLDLAKSGLTVAFAEKRLGYGLCTAEQAWALLRPNDPDGREAQGFTAEGYVIRYPGLNFFRFRRLRGKFNRDDDGRQRYAQPVNSLPHLYVSRIGDWPKAGPDGKRKIVGEFVFTEGEKKADKACQCGIRCVALGGVESYQSARHAMFLVEELAEFDLTEADVVVTYDSDSYTNPNVRRAQFHLAAAIRRAHHPRSIGYRRLTSESAEKQALDDFLAAFPSPAEARRAYERLPKHDDAVQEAFATFNDEVAHVIRKARYFNIPERVYYPSQKQVVEQYALGAPVLAEDGKAEVFPIALWLTQRDGGDTTVRDVVYAPGAPPRFRADKIDKHETLNLWRPSGLEPRRYRSLTEATREAQPFLEFVAYLTPGLTTAERDALLDWAAHPLQRPGAKIDHAVLIWSVQNGTGKNTLARVLAAAYGRHNVSELNGSALDSRFNEWTQHQLAIVNEVHVPTYNERAAVMERLKTLVTEDTVRLEQKFIAAENVPNHVNLFLTSNKPDALPLDESDRRFFVIHAPEVAWPKAKFQALNNWLEGDGAAKAYGYLLKRNLRAFNPHADAPKTEARAAMIAYRTGAADVLNDLVNQLWLAPGDVIGRDQDYAPGTKCEVFMPAQLVAAVSAYAVRSSLTLRQPITVNTLSASMKRYDFVKRVVRFKRSGVARDVTAYALFNGEAWRARSGRDWREHLLRWNKGAFDHA